MFERFSSSTVRVVHHAVREAHDARAAMIEEEHLVYGLFRVPDSIGGRIASQTFTMPRLRETFQLARRRGGISKTDLETLHELGVDVEEMVRSVERQFGEAALAPPRAKRRGWFGSHIPFSAGAKLALEGALTEAKAAGDRHIDDRHLLLAILRRGDVASGVLSELGLSLETVLDKA